MRIPLLLALAAISAGCGERTPEPAAPAASTSARSAPAPAAPEDGVAVGQRIPAFSATVRRFEGEGVKESPFDPRAAKVPTAYVFNSTTCPYCVQYVDRMKALEGEFLAKGVDLVHVYPNRKESTAEKVEYHGRNFKAAQIVDSDASIARALKIDKTPTVVVTDAAGTIAYRGRIDDSPSAANVKVRHLAEALDALLAAKPVAVKTTEPFG